MSPGISVSHKQLSKLASIRYEVLGNRKCADGLHCGISLSRQIKLIGRRVQKLKQAIDFRIVQILPYILSRGVERCCFRGSGGGDTRRRRRGAMVQEWKTGQENAD